LNNIQKLGETSYLITLPDGCTPGRTEAAKAFAEAVESLGGQCNCLLPFSYDGEGALIAVMAFSVYAHRNTEEDV